MRTRVQGLAVEERQAAAGQIFVGRVNTAGLGGRGGAHPGRCSRMRNVETPSGSGSAVRRCPVSRRWRRP